MGRGIELGSGPVDLDGPVARRTSAQERERDVVWPAQAVIDLHGPGEAGLDRVCAAIRVGGKVTSGIGTHIGALIGIQVGANADGRGGPGHPGDAAHVDGLQLVHVDDLLIGVECPALHIEARCGAHIA